MEHNPIPIEHNPIPMEHNPTPMEHNPIPMEHNPIPMEHNPDPMEHNSNAMEHNPNPKPVSNPNPWNVSDPSLFLKYCCPECDFQIHNLNVFEVHATSNHEASHALFGFKGSIFLKGLYFLYLRIFTCYFDKGNLN